MRIDPFNKVSQLYKANNVKSTSKTKGSSLRDSLEISQVAKDYQVARQIVNRTPDVREDKIFEIKRRMETGVYNVSMEEVADKLVESFFNETI
jgi:negative regulator of flagellin synthesis FlgM